MRGAATIPLAAAFVALLGAGAFSGCDRLFDKGSKEAVEKADKKVATGDFHGAVSDYEAALDGSDKSANVHYKLALLYDSKLKSPRDAAHHLNRYLQLAPAGPHAREAKTLLKQADQAAMTESKGSLITQEEAVRIKNENLALRKSLVEVRAQKNVVPAAVKADKGGELAQKPIPPGSRTHVVQPGETMGSIAKKYYKNKERWKDIQDANFYATNGTPKIKAGQTLLIP